MSKGNKGFGSMFTEGLDDEENLDKATPADGIMASRSQTLARIATGKTVADRTEWVDPERCRPWRMHNRDLDHLNEDSCRDLIDSFLSAKKQRIPAIVRRLKDDPNFDFEIIAGVRRWWTVKWLRAHHHPEFEYLVTIQSVTDEEAFRVSDVENRSRKDISDWERAKEYTVALAEFYEGSQSQMAEHLNLSKSWLSRLLDVARLPEPVVAAFSDTHDITVRVARDIKPLTGDPKALAKMREEAERIEEERSQKGLKLSGPEVAKRLVKATVAPAVKAAAEKEITGKGGKVILRYTKARGGGLTIKVPPKAEASPAELLKAIEGLLS
ncbi:chromosome partitioning protein, ParB family [Sphingomonas sp. OV641]|jgi:ParB family chromosome partitioning protein|uniref:Chromosome partitioning protein ParB n=8 Tax=Sphingomonadaceae TaxID=41297 RepID=A0A1L3ZX59_9SPHN|nr:MULTISPECIES: ParB/RepB/Spo0J family partition protein [Sphingomonadaceae]API60222.1 chromosome partitioning protein ParB [Tardibacter chloracetimidivorans]EGI53944.1 parB-like partition s domain protein [Sphingomonas sp. S17]KEQ51735.1 ParB-like partition s domain protein [Sphingobium chlorophenolicum]KKI21407.1 chromosome partitioning protein ParB [Sphingomonas sp. Ag1]MCM3681474.1 ParB/RepB/Spo0J family partition protein [Sphingomonas paucimobilis]